MKELKEIKKSLPYGIRLKMAVKNRALKEQASRLKYKSSVEAFNNKDIFKEPDTFGITIYYPNKENPTHFVTGIFSSSIGMKEFGKQIKKLEKQLLKKAKA